MRKYFIIMLTFIVFLNNAGCSQIIVQPADIMKGPGADKEYIELKETVNRYLPDGGKLIVPVALNPIDKIRLLDVNDDGKKEALAFYQAKNCNIGLLLLQKVDNKWVKIGTFETWGEEIAFFKIVDLNQDNNKEILLGCSFNNMSNKELTVLSVDNVVLTRIKKLNYTEVEVSDLNNNAKPELFILQLKKDTQGKTVSHALLYEYINNDLQCISSLKMTPFINGNYHLAIGQASKDKRAAFLDIRVGDHYAYTDMIMWEEGRLVAALQEPVKKTYKQYMYMCQDIDNDGIIEIPFCKQLHGYEDTSLADTQRTITWHKWQPDKKLSATVMETFWYYPGRYILKIPDKWQDRITIRESGNEKYKQIDVYYLYEANNREITVLRLITFENREWKTYKKVFEKIYPEYIMMGRCCNQVTVAITSVPDMDISGDEYKVYCRYTLTEDELKALFKFNDQVN